MIALVILAGILYVLGLVGALVIQLSVLFLIGAPSWMFLLYFVSMGVLISASVILQIAKKL